MLLPVRSQPSGRDIARDLHVFVNPLVCTEPGGDTRLAAIDRAERPGLEPAPASRRNHHMW